MPAIGERDQRPLAIVIVGGFRRAAERHHAGHEILVRNRGNRHVHGIQQSLELCFAHGSLRLSSASVAKLPFFAVEGIVQIVSFRKSKPMWLTGR